MKIYRMLWRGVGLLALLWMGLAQALPQVDEVQAATRRGDYAAAEKMMREVVAAKPDSARAHYVLAEILAHERQFAEATEHTRRARSLDPAIKFTDAERFSAFERLLQREQAGVTAAGPGTGTDRSALTPNLEPAPAARTAPPAASPSNIPFWMLVAGGVVAVWALMRWVRRRAAAASAAPALAGGYGQAGYGTGYGPGMPPAPGAGGPGMLGVGLGVAGGVAAGMLAERLLHGGHDGDSLPRDRGEAGAGGLVPGSFDTGAADELTRRDIDFGAGDGWDGGADLGGDFGGGGSDDW